MATERLAVLVVDDEPSVRTSLCTFLHHHGFTTVQAETVDAALKTLGTERVDAAILDVVLPDPGHLQRSGLDFLVYLRLTPEYEHLPVVIFTGKPLTTQEEDLVRRSQADVFYKPEHYATLVKCLDQAARHSMPSPILRT